MTAPVLERLRDAISTARSKGRPWAEIELEGDVERLLQTQAFNAVFVWDTRGSETLDGELLVGLGVAHQVVAESHAALRPLVEEMMERFAHPKDRTIRAFGTLAFDERADAPVASWKRAFFAVPRWIAASAGPGKCRLQLILSDELDIERDLRSIETELSTTCEAPARSARVVEDGGAEYLVLAQRAIDAVTRGDVEKVVVARRALVQGAHDAGHVLARLVGTAGCVRYGLITRDASFVGASPEVLVAADARGIRTEAVAGTEPRRGADFAEVTRLLMRDKDRREHAVTAETIQATLARCRCVVTSIEEPRVRTLTYVHHLVTPMTAVRPQEGAHVLDLALALHPTPAMGGAPRQAAAAFLRDNESFARGSYASPVGWVDAAGNGAFVVGIRSAVLTKDLAYVHAGAGIVRGSLPHLELAETTAKMRTMLDALGVPAPEARPQRSIAAVAPANLGVKT